MRYEPNFYTAHAVLAKTTAIFPAAWKQTLPHITELFGRLPAILPQYRIVSEGEYASSPWCPDQPHFRPPAQRNDRTKFPSMVGFVHAFFNNRNGVYRYLSELLVPQEKGSYKLQPHNVVVDAASSAIFRGEHLSAYAARVIHGSVPALAWSVEIGGKSIVVSGDTNGEGADLVHLAKDADLFIAHNAVPEGASGVERQLHMPPSVIGQIAQEAHVKRLVLSHRMLRTLGKEEQSISEISKNFLGPVAFANDLDCFPVR